MSIALPFQTQKGYLRWWLGGDTSDLQVFLTEEFSEAERTWRLAMWIAAGLFMLRGAMEFFSPEAINWQTEVLFRMGVTAELILLAFSYGLKSAVPYRTPIVFFFLMSYGFAIAWSAHQHQIDMGILAVPFILILVFGVLMWPRIDGLYWPVLAAGIPAFTALYILDAPRQHIAFYAFYFFVGLAFAIVFRRSRLRKSFALFVFRERLRDENTKDVLTGLLNRAGWRTCAEPLHEDQLAQGKSLSIAFLDIDHFKKVNDKHGHAAGDRVLMDTARILARHLPSRGFLARLGGEEFVAALPDLAPEQADVVLERMRKAVADHEGMARVTISIGVARAQRGKDLTQTMHEADMLLLHAKESGRNRLVTSDNQDISSSSSA